MESASPVFTVIGGGIQANSADTAGHGVRILPGGEAGEEWEPNVRYEAPDGIRTNALKGGPEHVPKRVELSIARKEKVYEFLGVKDRMPPCGRSAVESV